MRTMTSLLICLQDQRHATVQEILTVTLLITRKSPSMALASTSWPEITAWLAYQRKIPTSRYVMEILMFLINTGTMYAGISSVSNASKVESFKSRLERNWKNCITDVNLSIKTGDYR